MEIDKIPPLVSLIETGNKILSLADTIIRIRKIGGVELSWKQIKTTLN